MSKLNYSRPQFKSQEVQSKFDQYESAKGLHRRRCEQGRSLGGGVLGAMLLGYEGTNERLRRYQTKLAQGDQLSRSAREWAYEKLCAVKCASDAVAAVILQGCDGCRPVTQLLTRPADELTTAEVERLWHHVTHCHGHL